MKIFHYVFLNFKGQEHSYLKLKENYNFEDARLQILKILKTCIFRIKSEFLSD